jgi:hypothetical protein
MTPTYFEFAAIAFELMALHGLLITTQEALTLAEHKASASHSAKDIAAARAQVEAKIAAWNQVRP